MYIYIYIYIYIYNMYVCIYICTYSEAVSGPPGPGADARPATHCNTLQHSATLCNNLQHPAKHCCTCATGAWS